jgi:hypothetical protein
VLRRAVALAIVLLCVAARAEASFDILNVVAVPMENGDEGTIELRYVTYDMLYTSKWPGIEIQYTCSAAPVHRVSGVFRGADRESLDVDDGNIAHRAGLTIDTADRSDDRSWNSLSSTPPGARWGKSGGVVPNPYVDTLVVLLHTDRAYRRAGVAYRARAVGNPSAARDSMEYKELDAIVLTTIDCIRDNAERSAIPIRHVKLVVTGPARYRRLNSILGITSRPNRGPRHSMEF